MIFRLQVRWACVSQSPNIRNERVARCHTSPLSLQDLLNANWTPRFHKTRELLNQLDEDWLLKKSVAWNSYNKFLQKCSWLNGYFIFLPYSETLKVMFLRDLVRGNVSRYLVRTALSANIIPGSGIHDCVRIKYKTLRFSLLHNWNSKISYSILWFF